MTAAARLTAALRAFGNGFYRFASRPVMSWKDRESAEQEALADLRSHPGFAVIQDVFDEEVRRLFEAFLSEQDEKAAARLHTQAVAISRMVSLLDGAVTAKERQVWIEKQLQRQVDLLTLDRARRVDKQSRASQRAQMAAQT
jgi:hypothetical protein